MSGADYREQALKLFPHVCGRCAREFSGLRLRELTVHHKDGNHDRNPPDGSNWELLCVYCHENEHARLEDHKAGGGAAPSLSAVRHLSRARRPGQADQKGRHQEMIHEPSYKDRTKRD
jgi:HNH endonuclease